MGTEWTKVKIKTLKHKQNQGFKWWAGVDEILTNHACDIYEMYPYLVEMKSWLNELDERKLKH